MTTTTNTKAAKDSNKATVVIPEPSLKIVEMLIRGDAPYVQNKFSAKAREMMRQAQEAGSTAKSKKKREAKDFQALYEESKHRDHNGKYGIPATAFRNAMISACRLVGFHMTKAKLSVFVVPDAFDRDDATPMVHFVKGEPHYFESMTRNATGVADLRPRAMWDPGWEMNVRIKFDADQFTPADVVNLLARAGQQVGVGEGRPDGKAPASGGMGWGTFEVVINR